MPRMAPNPALQKLQSEGSPKSIQQLVAVKEIKDLELNFMGLL